MRVGGWLWRLAGGPEMNIFSLLDGLRAIARNGLRFATDPYDRERYRRLMPLATQSYSELLGVPDEAAHAAWRSEDLLPAVSN